jgi:hypothetical protein
VLAIMLAGRSVTLRRGWMGRPLLWGLVIALPLFLWARRSSKRQAPTPGAA